MASWASLILLSFAVSLDGFGVGVTYGVRKIRIPLKSIGIISFCSGLVIFLAMLAGTLLLRVVPPQAASAAGALILMAIGIWALIQLARSGEKTDEGYRPESESGEPLNGGRGGRPPARSARLEVWSLEIRRWGIIVQILRTPSAADMDRSGTIAGGEAFLLGAALSLDAFGAGIGAAMVGFAPPTTALLIAASSGLFLHLGTRFGYKVSGCRWIRQLSALPGVMLILMGLFKLFVEGR